MGAIGVGIATILSFIGINIYAAKLQVDGSKIARYQARQALKNPKSFVIYTPEQIEQAKDEIAKHPEWLKEKKKEKLNSGFFKSIVNLFKDRKAYKNFIKNDTDESKIVTRELTAEELENAKRDKEVIQRVVRIINNEAEKNSQRMEVAGDVLINGTPFLGAAVGAVANFVLNKFNVIDKFVDKNVDKNASEKTKELYNSLKKGAESGNPLFNKWTKFAKSFMNDTSNNLEESAGTMRKRSTDMIARLKRMAVSALAHPKGRGWMIAGIGSIITGTVGAFLGLKLQKSAARAGRFTAKQELEKDPKNFVGFTEDDYNEVKDVKSDKKSKSKIIENITFLPTVIKQYYAYDKFKKNEFKQKQLLQERLEKQDISDEQLKNAKNLQRKLFNTFEKVDDKSQSYSEATEAAIDIAQPFVWYGGILTMLSPLLIASVQVARGKMSPAKVVNKIAGFLSKSSNTMKSKWFKKYLNNVEKNVSTKVENTVVKSKPLGALLDNVNLKDDSILEIVSKSFNNFKNKTKDFAKMSNAEQENALWELEESLTKILKMKNPQLANKISDVFSQLRWNTSNPQTRADMLDLILNPTQIKSMSKERYDSAYKLLKGSIERFAGYEKLSKEIYPALDNIIAKMDVESCKNIYKEISQIPEIKNLIDTDKFDKFFNIMENMKRSGKSQYYIDELLSQDIMIDVITSFEKAQKTIKGTPELLKQYPQATELLNIIEKEISIPLNKNQIELLKKAGININPENATLSFDTLKQIGNKVKGCKFSDLKGAVPDKFKNPKLVLDNFKQRVQNMSDEEFEMFAERINFSSMDKKTMLEIIPKAEKIIDNIPKEELNGIVNKLISEFNAHPDEFVKLVTSGKIGNIFVTPGLVKAVGAAGITWSAFIITMTYILSSYLGELQLKAGRLGVMKAIEDLQDPRYYADIEPANNDNLPKIDTSKNTENGNLLNKFKN